MTKQGYQNMLSWVKSRPRLGKAVVLAGKIVTYGIYALYPLFFLHLVLSRHEAVYRYVTVPAVSFVVLSLIRYFLNFPRPYEKWDLVPLYPKSTRGKSFPSRHTFCAFIIAVAAFYIYPAAGVVIAAAGVVLAISRVLSGVHFIRDVAVGTACGLGFGIIGFYLI